MALVGIDAIDPLVGLFRRFGVLTAVDMKAIAQAAVGVATHAPAEVLTTDL